MIRPHVRLYPQCGACGDGITLGEKIVAGTETSLQSCVAMSRS
jgi:hypothetical protein